MSRQQVSHTWSFFLVLAALFSICVSLTARWRDVVRQQPIQIAVVPLPKRTTPMAPSRESATIVTALPAPLKPVVVEPHPLIASQRIEPAIQDTHEMAMRPSPNLAAPDWKPPETPVSVEPPAEEASEPAVSRPEVMAPEVGAPQDEAPPVPTPVVKGPVPQPVRPQLGWSPDSLVADSNDCRPIRNVRSGRSGR